MKFMTKLWALLVLIGVCSFGSQAYAQTRAETLSCMKAGLEAKPFTGSYASRLKQARQLQAGTVQVRVNDSWKPLPVGGSLWQLCEGPTLEERLDSANLTIGELAQTNGTLTEKVGKLTDELEATGGELTKAKTANADLRDDLQNLKLVSGVQWLVMILLLALFLMACYRDQMDYWFENRHQRSIRKHAKRPADYSPAPVTEPGDDTAPDSSPRHAI